MSRRTIGLTLFLIVYATVAAWATFGLTEVAAAAETRSGGSMETAIAFRLGDLEFARAVGALAQESARGLLVGLLVLPWFLMGLAAASRSRGWREGAVLASIVSAALVIPHLAALAASVVSSEGLSTGGATVSRLLVGLVLSLVLAGPQLAALVLARGATRWGVRLLLFIALGPIASAVAAGFLGRSLGPSAFLLELPLALGVLAAVGSVALAASLRLALTSRWMRLAFTKAGAVLLRRPFRLPLVSPRAGRSIP